jgi:protein involved in polysaccharide export with SLBB domain
VGDEIGVEFFYHPDLNRDVLVRPDGYISLPHVGEVFAAGETPGDLSHQISNAFVDVLKQRDITVVLRRPAARKVYVGGEVAAPQPVSLLPGMSISHAIFAVGGFRDSGRRETVLLLRYRPNEPPEVRTVDMSAVMQGDVPDPLLQPYDVLYVPKTTIAQVALFVDPYINELIPRSVSFATLYIP